MYGLQRRTEETVYMRGAAHNYGVKTQQPFSAFKHSGDVIYQDPFDAQQKAENQMTWLVKKGDLILSERPLYASLDICRKFRSQDNKSFCTHLLANDDGHAPVVYLQNGIINSLSSLCIITILTMVSLYRNADCWSPELQSRWISRLCLSKDQNA